MIASLDGTIGIVYTDFGDNPMLDLNHLRLFVEIVKVGSFAGTARRLGVPTNTVTRHIQQLEAAAHARLMHRSTRRLTLTSAGQTLYDRCAANVEELSSAAEDMIEGSQMPGGLIRVAATAGFFEVFAMTHLAEFLTLYPGIRVEFLLEDAKTDLIAESIDVAIRAGRLLKSSSVGRKLAEAPAILVASPSYLAKHGAPADPRALAEHQCIVMAKDSGRANWRLEGPSGSIEVTVSGRFRANSAGAVMQAAVAGLGIALLPSPVCISEVQAGRLVRVLREHRHEAATVYAAFPNRRHIPRAVSVFVDFVSEKLRLASGSWRLE
jgi:DNA-binding transcriptional LysR family regulator